MPSRSALVFASRGDPGIFSVFKRIGRGVAGFVKGGPTGALVGLLKSTKAKKVLATQPRLAQPVPIAQAGFATAGLAAAGAIAKRAPALIAKIPKIVRTGGKLVAGGALIEAGTRLIDPATGLAVAKRKRMNVLNPRALSRATRRLAGFNRRVKTVEKVLRRLAPPSRRRAPVHEHHGHHGHHGHHDS